MSPGCDGSLHSDLGHGGAWGLGVPGFTFYSSAHTLVRVHIETHSLAPPYLALPLLSVPRNWWSPLWS